jgi:hypothetical protein
MGMKNFNPDTFTIEFPKHVYAVYWLNCANPDFRPADQFSPIRFAAEGVRVCVRRGGCDPRAERARLLQFEADGISHFGRGESLTNASFDNAPIAPLPEWLVKVARDLNVTTSEKRGAK